MLAQILPGFRDFRTPLVTGLLWMVSLWLILGKPLPSKTRTDGLMGTVNALSEYLSPTLVLGLLSFAAYMIGMLMAVDIKVVTHLVQRFGWTTGTTRTSKGRKKLEFLLNAKLDKYQRIVGTDAGSTMRRLLWAALERVKKREVAWETIYDEYGMQHPDEPTMNEYFTKASGDPDEVDRRLRGDGLGFIAPVLLSDMEAEIPVMATKLQEKNKDLYDTYSREKSEAEFRLSVSVPIGVASVLIFFVGLAANSTLNTSIAVGGFIAAIVLLKKGWTKSQEATNVVVTALDIKVIDSKVLQRLDELETPKKRIAIPEPITG